MDNEDYLDQFNNKIEYAKFLSSIRPEYLEEANKLLEQKKEIMKKNGLFADRQLKKINKKIDRLKK